jgi:hypothetical protein
VPISIAIEAVEIEMHPAGKAREKSSEPDHAPLRQIERLKENFLCQLKRFTERFEDFDFRVVAVHVRSI